MSNRKHILRAPQKVAMIVLIAAILFNGCMAQSNSSIDNELNLLYEEGILSNLTAFGSQSVEYTLYEARVGDIVRVVELSASITFPVIRHLGFTRSEGYYSGAYTSLGQRVSEGDLLAEL